MFVFSNRFATFIPTGKGYLSSSFTFLESKEMSIVYFILAGNQQEFVNGPEAMTGKLDKYNND